MRCSILCRLLPVIKQISYAIMGNDPAHGWPHIERLESLIVELIENEGVDEMVDRCLLYTGLYLHDVGRSMPGDENHALKSASYAKSLLETLGVPESCIEDVVHVIKAHSFSLGIRAETLEAMILSDADKLDALGAVGIARVFHTGCTMKRGFKESIKHFYEKIIRLPELLYLSSAKEVARERIKIIEAFLEEWKRELGSY